MSRTYTELSRLRTFEERFDYLMLGGRVGDETFGFDRWINQSFYSSTEWRRVRQVVILRDEGSDLGILDYPIDDGLVVHHMNPITPDEVEDGVDWILDPEFLITTTQDTHNAIHYGDRSQIRKPYVERSPGDTRLW